MLFLQSAFQPLLWVKSTYQANEEVKSAMTSEVPVIPSITPNKTSNDSEISSKDQGTSSARTETQEKSGRVAGRSVSSFVQRNGRQLILNGEDFKSIGVNRYNLLTTGGTPYVGCAGVFSDADLVSWFSEVKNMGGTSVRFWLFQSFTKGGTDFTRLDYLLQLASENGIKVIPVLENQWADCTEAGYKTVEWYKDGYKSQYGTYALSYRDYVARVVSAYKNNPTIMLWQLMNEAETDHQALYTFAEDMTGLVKSLDSNHLVSLGTIGSGQKGAQETQYRTLHAIPTIDVVEYHDYHAEEMPFPDYDNFNSLKVRFSDAITLDKPMIMGESGIKANCLDDKCYTTARRAELFRAKLDEFFKRGGAAYLLWSYRDHAGAPHDSFNFLPGDPLVSVMRNQAAKL